MGFFVFNFFFFPYKKIAFFLLLLFKWLKELLVSDDKVRMKYSIRLGLVLAILLIMSIEGPHKDSKIRVCVCAHDCTSM